jgi:hypothetical protein
MIKLALLRVPESTISLRGLWNVALPAVVHELEAGGYTVEKMALEMGTEHGWLRRFHVGPGPAMLTAAANTSDDGFIVFELRGEKFGQKGLGIRNHDEALWDRLEALAQRLGVEHTVVSTIDDPDFATGQPGYPGTVMLERSTADDQTALTWTTITEFRRSLFIPKSGDSSPAASLSPIEHAWSDNREYLIGAFPDGTWWVAVEVDGQATTLAWPFPSEAGAKQHAEEWEQDRSS